MDHSFTDAVAMDAVDVVAMDAVVDRIEPMDGVEDVAVDCSSESGMEASVDVLQPCHGANAFVARSASISRVPTDHCGMCG
ncbi:MAG: hypothetical protein H6816_15835 [Phycisphaerales bacterium]|nr:hypothetical protein [Phycisphaerales bacterium]